MFATLAAGFGLLALLPAAASAQTNGFQDFSRAADAQYGSPEPTPTASPSGGAQAQGSQANDPSPGAGSAGRGKSKGDFAEGEKASRRGSRGNRDGSTGRDGILGGGAGGAKDPALPLTSAQGGRLPFTGLDLLLVACLGLALLAAGCAIRFAASVRSRSVA